MAQPNTALSPEWDRWFDETFTDLISSDDELTRAEFDALITASWPPPAPPAPSGDPGAHLRRAVRRPGHNLTAAARATAARHVDDEDQCL